MDTRGAYKVDPLKQRRPGGVPGLCHWFNGPDWSRTNDLTLIRGAL